MSEQDGVRYLHLGTPWVQGAMRVRKPQAIELEYVQRMMAWMLWRPAGRGRPGPRGAAGPGRRVHHALHAQGDAHAHHGGRTQSRPSSAPAACGSSCPTTTRACRWWRPTPAPGCATPRTCRPADVLSVDLYDHDAAAPVLDCDAFYAACHGVLAHGGLMAVNLFGRDTSFAASAARIASAFGLDQVWSLRPTREGNTVVIAGRGVACPIATRCPPGRITSNRASACRRASGCAWCGRYPFERQPCPIPLPSSPPPRHRRARARERAPRAATRRPPARLELRQLLKWLRDDGVLAPEEADKLVRRFGNSASGLHPLQRLGGASLVDVRDGRVLDTDALARWLAARFELPYSRIDPLRVDVGRVTEVMSVAYAEMRRALPVTVNANEVMVATSEPFDIALGARDRGLREAAGAAAAGASRGHHALHARVLFARRVGALRQQDHRRVGGQQLRAAGGAGQDQGPARRQRPGRGAGGGLAVAVRVRAARQRHPPGAAPRHGRDPPAHRRRAAHGAPGARRGDERDDRAHQAAGPHGRHRAPPPAGRPHQDASAPTARAACPAPRWKCACPRCPPRSARRW